MQKGVHLCKIQISSEDGLRKQAARIRVPLGLWSVKPLEDLPNCDASHKPWERRWPKHKGIIFQLVHSLIAFA